MPDENTGNIVASQMKAPEPPVDLTGGVKDGAVEKLEHPDQDKRDSITHFEQVVHEYDEKGNVVGFHKVAAPGPGDEAHG